MVLKHDGFPPIITAHFDRLSQGDFFEPTPGFYQFLQIGAADRRDTKSFLIFAGNQPIGGKAIEGLTKRAVPNTITLSQRLCSEFVIGR